MYLLVTLLEMYLQSDMDSKNFPRKLSLYVDEHKRQCRHNFSALLSSYCVCNCGPIEKSTYTIRRYPTQQGKELGIYWILQYKDHPEKMHANLCCIVVVGSLTSFNGMSLVFNMTTGLPKAASNPDYKFTQTMFRTSLRNVLIYVIIFRSRCD